MQQRLVSLALEARVAESSRTGHRTSSAPQLAHLGEGLVGAVDELREVSHGIHPAILSEGGLRPALSTLARRSPVPVELRIEDVERLPEPLEVGIYYVVSEALTNVIKHAEAASVTVDLEADGAVISLRVRDDGVGGADPGHGSGLIGLKDRVHALGGGIEITSPPGRGTSMSVSLPRDFAQGCAGRTRMTQTRPRRAMCTAWTGRGGEGYFLFLTVSLTGAELDFCTVLVPAYDAEIL